MSADGSVAPVSTVNGLAFSGGGDDRLAQISQDGKRMMLRWPTNLPKPALSGNVAVYTGVFPGVDLELRAGAIGFSQLLVVHTPEAARNPDVAKLKFKTEMSGLSLNASGKGELSAVDGQGSQVFVAPTPRMWDSAVVAVRSGESVAGLKSTAVRSASVEKHEAEMGVQVAPGELTLLPDQAMLTSAKTQFPLYIDPWVTAGGSMNAWTKILKNKPDQSFWNGANDSDPNNVGSVKVGLAPDGTLWRSLFQMDMAKAKGAVIHSATFRAYEKFAYSCGKTVVQAWKTDSISSSTDWNSRGGSGSWNFLLDSQNVAYRNDSYLKCNGGFAWVNFDVTDAVQANANNGYSVFTLGLRAPSSGEDDYSHWKRFSSGVSYDNVSGKQASDSSHEPYLEIQYSHKPNTPSVSELWTDPSDGTSNTPPHTRIPCSSNTPSFVNAAKPSMNVNPADDPDAGQEVKVQFSWKGPSGISHSVLYPSTGTKGQGSFWAQIDPADFNEPALQDGDAVSWQLKVVDEAGLSSNWTPWCQIKIATTVPGAPAVESSDGRYPNGQTGSGQVGQPGAFAVKAGSHGVAKVSKFEYQLVNGMVHVADAPSDETQAASVTVAPMSRTDVLNVRAIDEAGNYSQPTPWSIRTAAPTGPVTVGQWNLDDGAGTVASDATGNGHPLSLSGGAAWATGHSGRALSFNTIDDRATASDPLIHTNESFTVDAWVKLTKTDATYTAVSQDGGAANSNKAAGFYLGYRKAKNAWSFSMSAAATSGTLTNAAASTAPVLNTWTHLIGVYDADLQTLSLYVGTDAQAPQLAGQVTNFVPGWTAAGRFQIGQAVYNGVAVDNFQGVIDDVKITWGAAVP